MALVRFTQNIQRHVHCPARQVSGGSLRETLSNYFDGNDRARGYVLDETGAVRKHMAIFIDGRPIQDRATLADPVAAGATVDVMQALSGG